MKNSKTPKTETKTETATPIAQPELVKALDHLFKTEGWEIPDECVAGHVTNKVNQLEAQIKSLTSMVAALSAQVNGKGGAGRVDALAAAKEGK